MLSHQVVDLDPETEAIVTIGSKEGLANLAQAVVGNGDTVLVPNPAYPIHPYGFVIAGADIQHVPCGPDDDFFAELERSIKNTFPKPKMLVLNYPSNPTTECVELEFFERVIKIAKEHEIWVIQDLAYADIVFDGYVVQSIGWDVTLPKATMFVWAKIPEFYQEMGSLEFTKKLLKVAKVGVSPGIGFGDYGDNYVRFGLIENEHRTRQAVRGIREMFKQDGLL